MKTYYVVYKLFRQPGTAHVKVEAEHKHAALVKFKEMNIKHDHVIRIIT